MRLQKVVREICIILLRMICLGYNVRHDKNNVIVVEPCNTLCSESVTEVVRFIKSRIFVYLNYDTCRSTCQFFLTVLRVKIAAVRKDFNVGRYSSMHIPTFQHTRRNKRAVIHKKFQYKNVYI